MGARTPIMLKNHPEDVKLIVDAARAKGLSFDDVVVRGDEISFKWEGRTVRKHRVVDLPATVVLTKKGK